ncbi:MAG: cytidine deaminase [Pseudomonadota bacterium]
MKTEPWSVGEATLIDAARSALNPRQVTSKVYSGQVAAALISSAGTLHTGICIDAASSVGFCAEHAAIAAMLTAGHDRIDKIVAVDRNGNIKPPCGRCRELMRQMGGATVLMPGGAMVDVLDLLPGQKAVGD